MKAYCWNWMEKGCVNIIQDISLQMLKNSIFFIDVLQCHCSDAINFVIVVNFQEKRLAKFSKIRATWKTYGWGAKDLTIKSPQQSKLFFFFFYSGLLNLTTGKKLNWLKSLMNGKLFFLTFQSQKMRRTFFVSFLLLCLNNIIWHNFTCEENSGNVYMYMIENCWIHFFS